MNKLICVVLMTFTASSVVAVTSTNGVKRINLKDIPKEERQALILRLTGGMIGKPGTMQGKIVYVNAQKTFPREWIEQTAGLFNDLFRKKIRFDIGVKDGEFSFPNPKIEGEASLYIIDDPGMPTLLAAPENRWVMVNVTKLRLGEGAKPQFYEARVKKTIMRGAAILCGAQDSSYPRCLLTCKTEPSQLDINPDTRLPVDVVGRFEKYLAGYGIKPEQMKPYRTACEEGWAPKPTNKIQQEVWDEVHALPSDPIKIKYDPKRDK